MAIDPNVQPWVQKYPMAWAETVGVGLAKQRPPIIVELKADATPVWVKQYPLSLRPNEESRHISRGSLKVGFSEGVDLHGTLPCYPEKA